MYFDQYTTNWYQNSNLSAREINLCQISTSYSVFGACVFDDLHEVAANMNYTFGAPVITGDKVLNYRKSIVTPSVEHVLSISHPMVCGKTIIILFSLIALGFTSAGILALLAWSVRT